jgi:hypothetical protein
MFSQPAAEVVLPTVRVAMAPFPPSATAGSLGFAVVVISFEVFMKAVEAHTVVRRRGSHIFSRQSAHRWPCRDQENVEL